jgi:c-di-GMP-binding flagellar brake protein YcgR
VRSGREIARLLGAMQQDGDVLIASPKKAEVIFISRLLEVAPDDDCIVVECADYKQSNTALLAEKSPRFYSSHRGLYYRFAAGNPREIKHRGAVAIRAGFPDAMLVQRRREQGRVRIPARVAVRCEVPLGVLSFEAAVTDISPDGTGVLVFGPDIRLEPGSRIESARILAPRRKPVTVALEVDGVKRVRRADGSPVNRAHCRVFAAPGDMGQLIGLFMIVLA